MKTFLIIVFVLVSLNVFLLVFSCNKSKEDTVFDSDYPRGHMVNFIIMMGVLSAFNVLLHAFSKEPTKEENGNVSSYGKNSISKSE